jgi:hypothetical protein
VFPTARPWAFARGAGKGVSKYRTRVPILPDVADRILRGAHRDDNGCLISPLAPGRKRPSITMRGRTTVIATRVVMAAYLGRAIEPDEDAHHSQCRTGRCVEPTHLAVIPVAEHQADHGAERRLEVCPRHNRQYDYRDRWGKPHCRKCQAEADARFYRRHPRPPLTEEQRLRRNERTRLRRLTPEGGAKMRARERAAKQRKKARAAANSTGCPAA